MSTASVVSTDVLVVGTGVGGLAAALYADGRDVVVLGKSRFARGGSSVLAQGGVAVALGDDDSPERHAADTVAVGCGLSDPGVARLVTREGPGRVRELLRLGARLDRERSGRVSLGREAAHSRRRVVHAAGDGTGAELVRTLAAAVWASQRVRIDELVFAGNLLVADGRVVGVAAVDHAGRTIVYRASSVVLATGGSGRMYQWTTNPEEATGDGLAMAARAGARLTDLEFVQYHPTALADGSDPMALLTEALRGEGAVMVDDRGVRFMKEVHPAAELAPRDVVARALWRHHAAGHQVYLDARALGDRMAQRFPTVTALCHERGLDPLVRPLPISPAAHYHMGGVVVDLEGRTSLPGLWACGEVAATGLHGANRLASNSLLEALVLGARVGEAVSAVGLRKRSVRADVLGQWGAPHGNRPPRLVDDPAAAQRAEILRRVMWRDVGVERSAAGLGRAIESIDRIASSCPSATGELANMVTVSRLVATAALARAESRGAHFRLDRPETALHWRRHLVFEGERLLERSADATAAVG